MSKKIVDNIREMLKLIASPVYISLHILYTCLGQLKWAVFPIFFIDHFLELILGGAPYEKIGVTLGVMSFFYAELGCFLFGSMIIINLSSCRGYKKVSGKNCLYALQTAIWKILIIQISIMNMCLR